MTQLMYDQLVVIYNNLLLLCIFISVKCRVNDVVGGVPVHTITLFLLQDLFIHVKSAPGRILENDSTLHHGSVCFKILIKKAH